MEEVLKLFDKTFGVSSVGCPWGSCTEDFLLCKAIETIEKSNLDSEDKENLKKLFNEDMYHNRGKYSNGKHSGLWYMRIIEDYFTSK